MFRLKTFCLAGWACLCIAAQAQPSSGTPAGPTQVHGQGQWQAATAAGTGSTAGAAGAAGEASVSHPAVELARKLLGIPYRWAGADPAKGFDCSGLVYYVFNELQVRVPRMQRELFKSAEQVGKTDLKPGDLLFFNTFARLSHVGIYIGEGRFIHAPRRGTTVTIESMDSSYYRGRFAGARRVMNPAPGAAAQPEPGP